MRNCFLCLQCVLLMMLFFACEKNNLKINSDDCNDWIGSHSYGLTSKSLEYNTSEEFDTLIFRDSSNVELLFYQSEYKNYSERLYYTKYCNNGIDSINYTIGRQRIITKFKNDSLNIEFYLDQVARILHSPQDASIPEIIYDKMVVVIKAYNETGGYWDSNHMEFITDERGNSEYTDSIYHNQPIPDGNRMILGKNFENVYSSLRIGNNYSAGCRELYFSKGLGVIGFSDSEDKRWVYKERF